MPEPLEGLEPIDSEPLACGHKFRFDVKMLAFATDQFGPDVGHEVGRLAKEEWERHRSGLCSKDDPKFFVDIRVRPKPEGGYEVYRCEGVTT